MNRPKAAKTRAIRRILVALDASAPSLAALDAAVLLAVRLHAEIEGVFVEDTSLLRMADLPITREVGALSGIAREFDRRDMERHLRAQSALAERLLAETADRAHVTWSFRVSRGPVTREILAASLEVDLVTVGCQGSNLSGWRAVGSTAHAVLSGTTCPVLVMRHGARLGPPVYAVFDGSPSSIAVLSIAAELARAMDDLVVVVTADDGSGDAEALAETAAAQLGDLGVAARFRRFRSARPATIAGITRDHGCGVLVLPADSPWLTAQALQDLTRDVRCPVLLARGGREADDETASAVGPGGAGEVAPTVDEPPVPKERTSAA